jgi:predicted flap endonuclease-1-like 5' DNA nuclease
MRTVYLLILLFLVACIIGAEIYIYQIKSIGFLQAPTVSRALWIIELLVMLLVACLIGFAIAWQLREAVIANHKDEIFHLDHERNTFAIQTDQVKQEYQQLQSQLFLLQENDQEEIKSVTRERDRIKEELLSIQSYIEELKNEKSQLKKRGEQLEKEIQSGQDNAILLKYNLDKVKAENEVLNSKINKSFTLPPKDDLKLIHGIGPSIEKKLNALGIYSFRQISEFTPRAIDEITQTIKFFPGRIERDKWVSQARNFEEEKKRQSST